MLKKKESKKKKAEEIFSLIEKFAQYGFNKSHSTAYAYIAYQTAWLKVHHPAEFMSANLTSEMGSIDRIVVLINECKKMGIEVLPPDINVSFEDFRPIDNNTISYGLNAIKNVGAKALETIIKERIDNGIYKTIFDICSRIEQQKVNKRVLESLVFSGSMDGLEGSRAQNFDAVDIAIKYGQKMQQETDKNQVDLFGVGEMKDELIKIPVLENLEEWSEKESLSREMEVLGLYVSGHPLLEHADDLEEFTTVSFEEGQELSKNNTVFVGGMITKIVRRYDKRNREMAFFDLDCLGGHAEIVVFSDCYKSYGNLIEEGERYHRHQRTMFGLLGQQVKESLTKLGLGYDDFAGFQDKEIEHGPSGWKPSYTEENKTISLAYDDFIAPLIKSVQELSAEVDSLKKQLKTS